MSVVILIDFHEVKQIWRKTISPLSKFDEIATRLGRTANLVKQEWNNFLPENREQLKELAYTLIAPRKKLSNLKDIIWIPAYMLFIKATNQTQEFNSCIIAIDMLINNILDAVEQEDPNYQLILSDALEQISSTKKQGKVVEAEETRDWLQKLSDSEFEE